MLRHGVAQPESIQEEPGRGTNNCQRRILLANQDHKNPDISAFHYLATIALRRGQKACFAGNRSSVRM